MHCLSKSTKGNTGDKMHKWKLIQEGTKSSGVKLNVYPGGNIQYTANHMDPLNERNTTS